MKIFPRTSTDYVLLGIWHSANIANVLSKKVLSRSVEVRSSLNTARSPLFEGRGTTIVEETGQEIHSVVDNAGGDKIRRQRQAAQRTNYKPHSADAPSGVHVQHENECIAGAAKLNALDADGIVGSLRDNNAFPVSENHRGIFTPSAIKAHRPGRGTEQPLSVSIRERRGGAVHPARPPVPSAEREVPKLPKDAQEDLREHHHDTDDLLFAVKDRDSGNDNYVFSESWEYGSYAGKERRRGMCTADAVALSRRKQETFREIKELERQVQAEKERGKQLEEENARMKETQKKSEDEEIRGDTFNVFRRAIMGLRAKRGDNPLSPSYDEQNSVIQEILRNAEKGREALQLEEEDIKELKDLATPDFEVSSGATVAEIIAEVEEQVDDIVVADIRATTESDAGPVYEQATITQKEQPSTGRALHTFAKGPPVEGGATGFKASWTSRDSTIPKPNPKSSEEVGVKEQPRTTVEQEEDQSTGRPTDQTSLAQPDEKESDTNPFSVLLSTLDHETLTVQSEEDEEETEDGASDASPDMQLRDD